MLDLDSLTALYGPQVADTMQAAGGSAPIAGTPAAGAASPQHMNFLQKFSQMKNPFGSGGGGRMFHFTPDQIHALKNSSVGRAIGGLFHPGGQTSPGGGGFGASPPATNVDGSSGINPGLEDAIMNGAGRNFMSGGLGSMFARP